MGVFSVFGSGKKEKANDGAAYYRRLAAGFAAAKYACLILCLGLVLCGFSFRTDEINADNFNYLLNYLGEGETKATVYNTIYFDDNETNGFAVVRGDFAVVNDGGSAVYTLAGDRRSVDSALRFEDPQVLSGTKFMYIYDIGGAELVIKSALETVSTLRFDYPIRGAAATEGGYLAVICEEKTSRSSVYVYDDSFRMIYDCAYGSLYTVSADLDETARRLVTASVSAEGGQFVTTLLLYSLDAEEPIARQVIEGEYPYKAAFCEGSIALLTDRGLRLYGADGGETASIPFGDAGISAFDLGDRYFVRQYPVSALSSAVEVEVYDSVDGSLALSRSFPEGTRLAKSGGGYLFTVSGSTFTATEIESGKEVNAETDGEVLDVLEVEEGKLLVVSKGRASVLDYGALFATEEEESWAQS